MKAKRMLLMLSVFFVLTALVQIFVLAVPAPVFSKDTVYHGFLSNEEASLFSDTSVTVDIGAKSAASNVRYAEINGVQKPVDENDNKYVIEFGEENMLVEIIEKVSPESVETVKTQYFYIDVLTRKASRLQMNDYMSSYSSATVRVSNPIGIRFRARVSKDVKEVTEKFTVTEYGFVVAVTDTLGENELTLDFPKSVSGIGYSRENNIDMVFDSANDDFDVFTGVLKNIPVKQYKTNLTCKTYTKIAVGNDVFTVYGEPVVNNIYDAAVNSFLLDYTNTAVSKIIFDYTHYVETENSSFQLVTMSKTNSNGTTRVRCKFNSTDCAGSEYYMYLVTYDAYGNVMFVDRSKAFTLKTGDNSFSCNFTEKYPGYQTKAYVFTSDMKFICQENVKLLFYIDWEPANSEFYDNLSNTIYDYGTDFEGYFVGESDVSVIDGITAVSNLHARYKNVEITRKDFSEYLYSLELDDASVLVDLSDRNSVNLAGINFQHAEGGIDEENGYLYGTSVKKDNGGYDPQVVINGLNLDARNYNKIVLRIKYARASGSYVNLPRQTLQVFFKTNTNAALNEAKSARYELKNVSNVYDWFEVELDMTSNEYWKDVITGIRIDPLNNNAKFYIDYVKFVKSENQENAEWYDAYLDYAYDNNLVKLGTFNGTDFDKNITRKEFFDIFFKAYPESFFAPINSVSGIPDVDKNSKNAEVYLMLYNAGITLGFDDDGNLGLDEDISKSEVAAIINRILVEENRLKGDVDSDWDEQGSEFDFEFNNTSDSNLFTIKKASIISNVGGHLKLCAQRDAYMVYNKTVSIDADKYTKLRIRVKAEYEENETPPINNQFEFFFLPQGVSEYSGKYCVTTTVSDFYLDELGWYIFEIDLSLNPMWKGTITNLRYDMINDPGTYTYDYIRFIENPYYGVPDDHEGLVAAGYTATKLMPDGFENGFVVSRVDQSVAWPKIHGMFNDYCSTINPSYDPEVDKPLWTIGPWWQGTGEGFSEIDLIENRDTTTGIYTLADTYGVNTITYDPVEKSITQRLNATKIYNGKPHDINTYKWWPHQLLDTNANFTSSVDMQVNSADADRMFVELDIRMLDFKNTANPEGRNVCSYLAYFYFRPKSNHTHKIWFGLHLFTTSATTSDPIGLNAPTNVTPNWSPDSAAHQYMYGMPMAVVYDGIENSFNPSKGVAAVSDEWKHIRLDITQHIERAIEWANRDNIFGMQVSKEDMFFNGVNIGYEIHGNYDCTFEIKNFNMIAYNR